jgi:mRNA interferase MazF
VFLSSTEGMPRDCAINCDHIQTVAKAKVGKLISSMSSKKMAQVGKAISFALDIN